MSYTRQGNTIQAGATNVPACYPGIDFETFSEVDIKKVSSAKYAEHSSTDIICLQFQYAVDSPISLWTPLYCPSSFNDLLLYVRYGGILAAANSQFEFHVWNKVGCRKYGWPPLYIEQLRDSLALSRLYAGPGKLEDAVKLFTGYDLKDPIGKRLIQRLSKPKVPTLKDPDTRRSFVKYPTEYLQFYQYCHKDVIAEQALQKALPPMGSFEDRVFITDQKINTRGIRVDISSVKSLIYVFEKMSEIEVQKLQHITSGEIESAGQVSKIIAWSQDRGVDIPNLREKTVNNFLNRRDIPKEVHDVLRIRSQVGSSSIKKLYSMERSVCDDGRVYGLFLYGGAGRTLRWSSKQIQLQNIPSKTASLFKCSVCGSYYGDKAAEAVSGFCHGSSLIKLDWSEESIDIVIRMLNTRDLNLIQRQFKNPFNVLIACLRSMLVSQPGYRFICSDYSAIEAVVLAVIAGEQWRIDVFKTHGKIYEASASMLTGIPLKEILEYKNTYGKHHPIRRLGKLCELAFGYQGGYNAALSFGALSFLQETEIWPQVWAWRKASPMIKALWRNLNDAAVKAIRFPNTVVSYRLLSFGYNSREDILYFRIPSGRCLKYHSPQVREYYTTDWKGKPKVVHEISYLGWNSNPDNGKIGWIRMKIYGGRFTENAAQAISRDIQANGLINLEERRYHPVLHVHDEICSEVPDKFGSISEHESIMADLPTWAHGWPLKAHGWEGRRYRKD